MSMKMKMRNRKRKRKKEKKKEKFLAMRSPRGGSILIKNITVLF